MEQTRPLLSLVVMVRGISRQAQRTLETLSPAYQRNVAAGSYEIVVVERASADLLGENASRAALPAARYVAAGEASLGDAAARGLHECRAPLVGLLFDGATLVTPRLVEHALLAARAYEAPIVAVPGYQLGKEPQHLHGETGYDERAEAELLGSVDYRRDGHALFEISCRDPAFQNGFLAPFSELGCVLGLREHVETAITRVPPLDTEGELALVVLGRLCTLPGTKLVVLASEGTFHQLHDCPSTQGAPTRRANARELRHRLLGSVPPPREPTLLGAFPGQSMLPLLAASHDAVMYHALCAEYGRPAFPEDAT